MNKQHIAASQRLSECEGMVKSDLTLDQYGPYERELIPRNINQYGSWLKIDSQSLWCAFKFLRRCGWDANGFTLPEWLGVLCPKTDYENENSWNYDPKAYKALIEIKEALKASDLELAFILAIILLSEIAPELYKKGIEPLMGE